MSDTEFDAWMESIPPAPGIRPIDDDDGGDDARALAEMAAGRYHEHAIVGEWLKTWGHAGQKPFKEWLAARNG